MCTYTSIEIKLSNHFFHFLRGRAPQRRCVEIVELVKSKQLGKVGERLIAYSIHDLIGLLDFVDDIVTNFRVLPKNQNNNNTMRRVSFAKVFIFLSPVESYLTHST